MSELNFTHPNGNKVKLTTPDTLAANKTFKLPGADGSTGQFLKTDGSGALSFATVSQSSPSVSQNTGAANNNILQTLASNITCIQIKIIPNKQWVCFLIVTPLTFMQLTFI